jgi:hypothetical protein
VSEDKRKIKALRKDLFLATANRGLAYTAILREMREELGAERASEIFRRALQNHGVNMARIIRPPDKIEEFRGWLSTFLPDGGDLHNPEVIHCDQDELVIKLRRCPLKDAWRMFGLSQEEVVDMCEHADRFDHGFFGSLFEYSMDLWNTQPDDSCVLRFKARDVPA